MICNLLQFLYDTNIGLTVNWLCKLHSRWVQHRHKVTETYSEPRQTIKIALFAKKNSTSDVRLGSESTFKVFPLEEMKVRFYFTSLENVLKISWRPSRGIKSSFRDIAQWSQKIFQHFFLYLKSEDDADHLIQDWEGKQCSLN